ncbi:NeuD/PglB/VioB family sugar acetyltransferase [Microbacterium croceum]|uniref:NeuD/PglB/VioB family sugar acetyltransferase n=1 Tax=Microbacterium croceum TaxID=2851645 RepID=UPI001FFC84EB|nr:NeuD/PglB/VioB family sugar acetyltransferase [Microbacterium croceum]
MVVVGGGGFGRETLDVLDALIAAGEPLETLGVLDASPRGDDLAQLAARGVAYLGTDAEWLSGAAKDVRFVVAIGDPAIRRRVAEKFADAGLRAATLIHPKATIGSQARIGRGVVVAAGVQVSTNVTLGAHVHLNPASVIGHDAVLSDFVSVNPGAIVSGHVRVEAGVLLGAGSVVLQGLAVGEGATVGASACVTKDVSPHQVVVGVPAREIARAETT